MARTGDILYLILPSDSPLTCTFSINRTTGDIFLHSALDRETFSSDPDLSLNSRRGEEAASFTIDPASGEVRTWWDLDREEQEQATLTITDNAGPGDFLYKLEVRDEDSGANSQLQYFLLGEAGSGVLTSRSNVRNVGEVFSLEVKVSDSGATSIHPGAAEAGGQLL